MAFGNSISPTIFPIRASGTRATAYNDPSLSSYWYLWSAAGGAKGVNAVSVWDDYRGTGVVVGVIDDGIDYTHPELAANYAYLLDYDARDSDFDAYPGDPTDGHGTTVAGVIAAALNNAAGGAGVAPGATVTGYRIGFGSNGNEAQVLEAFERLSSVDVANNSWGYDGFLGDSFLDPEFAAIGAALQNALVAGRAGLGTVVVFSAGNGRTTGQDVNYHGFQNSRGVIAVAATDSTGSVTGFSTPGAALLVAAPGQGIPTTDRVGAPGYSSGDYATMSGTSFSSPIVSGVVALMLDANPALGWRDVQEILAATAVRTGSSSGWSFNGADNWNGGAMHVSHDYGFGLVDALAAARVAESWRGVSTSANEQEVGGVASPTLAIPDVGSVSSTISLAGGLRIDHVEIDVALLHTNIGQLEITLTAPDGTQSRLLHNPPTSQGNIYFTFSTTRDWGELSDGEWTLTVSDTQAGASGTLSAWAVTAYGDPVGDDAYVYTDEFSALAPGEPTRLLVTDLGGTDTINAAAIITDTLLDLRPGQVSSIDGQAVTISIGTVIENADTGDGNDSVIGNDAPNNLRAWRGNDLLDGGAGADTLDGGTGDDTYIVDSAGDLVVEAGDSGSDSVRTTLANYLLGANLENLAYTGTGKFAAVGNSAANSIAGAAGDDILNGGPGADTMIGGDGSDTYYVDNVGDVVSETNPLAAGGADLVNSEIDYTLGDNVETLRLIATGAINGTGNTLNNVLFAGAGNNILDGALGTDTVSYTYAASGVSVSLATSASQATGGSGSDTLLNIESLIGSNHNDVLTGNAGNNVLTGGLGADSLSGGDGADVLNGGAGADTMIGGDGTDTYYVDNVGDVVSETNPLAAGGADLVNSDIDYTLGDNVETLRLTATGAVNGTGNAVNNVLFAGAGNNILDGAAGTDTVSYVYAASGVSVSLATSASQATGGSGSDTLLNIESLIGSNYNDVLTGNAGNNVLTGGLGADSLSGGDGADTLNGGTGADTMIGGDGTDTYYVDNVGDVVSETNPLAAGGADLVNAEIDYTLGDNVETLRLTATGAVNGTGNALSNVLFAGAGNNILDGGLGTDTVSYVYAASGVSVSLTTNASQVTGGSGSDKLLNIESLIGSNYNDVLTGNAGNNVLTGGLGADSLSGGVGDDVLNGGLGADTMIGGDGTDTYYVDSALDVVSESNPASSGGRDIVYTEIDYTLGDNVESLRILAPGAINGTGNALNNSLYAGAGNNILDGGDGRDIASYLYASAGVTVSLATGAGQDTGSSGTDTLRNIEYLAGSAFDDLLTGNDGNNDLTGGMGADTLDGGAGADTLNGSVGADMMIGGDGNDIYYVDNVGDVVSETSSATTGGSDTVYSSISFTLGANIENLRLLGTDASDGTGNALNNGLYAGAGNNVLDGGDGIDTVSYLYATAGVSVSLAIATGQTTGGSGTDILRNVENLAGSAFDDLLRGNSGNNELKGGSGNDTLDGAGGSDKFVFGSDFGIDRINDFTPGLDSIRLSIALGVTDFSGLDTNANGFLDNGDAGVQIVGADTLIDFSGNQLQIIGQSQLNSSDFFFA